MSCHYFLKYHFRKLWPIPYRQLFSKLLINQHCDVKVREPRQGHFQDIPVCLVNVVIHSVNLHDQQFEVKNICCSSLRNTSLIAITKCSLNTSIHPVLQFVCAWSRSANVQESQHASLIRKSMAGVALALCSAAQRLLCHFTDSS
jgi:hypothetical protein